MLHWGPCPPTPPGLAASYGLSACYCLQTYKQVPFLVERHLVIGAEQVNVEKSVIE